MPIELRGYQAALVSRARESFALKNRAVLVVLPTGGGKTFIFCYIANSAREHGKNVLILVHRKELIEQTSRSLSLLGVDHGIIAPKHPMQLKKQVQIASIQTLARRFNILAKAGWSPHLIIADEAHHATAGTWRKAIDHWLSSRVLGVTATPWRLDGAGLGRDAGGVFDDLVQGPQIRDLIDEGHLVEPIVYAPPVVADLSGLRTKGRDYCRKDHAERMDKPTVTGDAVAHYAKICPGEPAIAFCVSVAHAHHVAEQFCAAGWRAKAIDGEMSDEERARAIADLAEGRLDVLTSCDIVSEGTDIPVVTVGILLRRTKSLSLYLQQVGRVLRPAPGKEFAIILDHVGNWQLHSAPDDPREWSLEGRSKSRKAANDNAPPAPVTCNNCFRQIKQPVPSHCPSCGSMLRKDNDRMDKLRYQDGELKIVGKNEKKAAARQRQIEQAQAKGLQELTALAARRGYKNPQKWAWRVHSARLSKRRNFG